MIKGGLFGKLLKQFFIISLISCFILLGNSFVNASVEGYVAPSNSFVVSRLNNDYVLTVYDNGTFDTTYFGVNKKIFMSDKGDYFFFDKSGLPYLSYITPGQSSQPTWGNQGNVSDILLCDPFSGNTTEIPQNCTKETYNNFSGYVASVLSDLDYIGYGTYIIDTIAYPNQKGYYVCFSNEIKNLCFYGCSHSNCGRTSDTIGGVTVSNNMSNSKNYGLEIGDISNNVIGNYPGYNGKLFVPSTGSRLQGRLNTSQGYTNIEMIEGYQCVGLTPELCYGGFPIDNIFDPSESFEDFTGYVAGQGATIFDLYSLYSSSFSNIDQFLNTVLTRYKNGQINSFKTEPKALLMLGSQMNVAGFKTSYISTYCNLLLNKNNNNSYTGNSIDDLRAQSCLRSQQVNDSLKTSDGLDINFQSSNIGIFSGEDVDFDPDTFFSNMFDKFSSGLNDISGGSVGLIPGYIILFTLALILIRMISH